MRYIITLLLFSPLLYNINFRHSQTKQYASSIIARGQMPNLGVDKAGNVHLVYGLGDSIMYAESVDHGISFSTPSLVAIVPQLFANAMRGPQIAASDRG